MSTPDITGNDILRYVAGELGPSRFEFNVHDRAILLCWAYHDALVSLPWEPGLGHFDKRELTIAPLSDPLLSRSRDLRATVQTLTGRMFLSTIM